MHALDQNDWHCRLCGQPLAQGSPNCRDGKVILSVLIPVHNESEQIVQNLSLIHAQASTTALPMEMIVIDDGSIDNTWQALEKMAEQMPELKALRFSRNFGKEAAICAGLAYSCGKACIVIDSDLQHPPELIPEMAHLWREEHWDIVEGIKRTRGTEPLINKIGARFFYRTLSRLSGYALLLYFTGLALPGFTTVIILELVIGGVLMISLGIIGTYIAQIYQEVKYRPRYVVAETLAIRGDDKLSVAPENTRTEGMSKLRSKS